VAGVRGVVACTRSSIRVLVLSPLLLSWPIRPLRTGVGATSVVGITSSTGTTDQFAKSDPKGSSTDGGREEPGRATVGIPKRIGRL